jgi:uncharacterized membrane protein YhaH (DUF805 family)
MTSRNSIFSASGRLARKPFALAITLLYVASFASQVLLAPPVMVRASVVPFAVVQAVVTWFWYVLHARRLREAGRGTGGAVAVAILYALAIVLLMLLIVPILEPSESAPDQPGLTFIGIWLAIFLFAAFTAQAELGFLYYVTLAILLLVLTPFLLGLFFSIWTGSRPPLPEKQAPG